MVKRMVIAGALAAVAANAADFKFGGDVQYRFRYERTFNKYVAASDTVRSDYTNRYAWNFKASVAPFENLLFALRLSNPNGSSTENIVENFNSTASGNYNLVAIPEFYVKWIAGIFSLSAGIIPVDENTVLNLVVYEDAKYLDVGTNPWSVLMNSSQKGVCGDFSLLKSSAATLKLGILAAIGRDAAASVVAPEKTVKYDQMRFMATAPVGINGTFLTVTPAFHLRTGIVQSADGEKTNQALAGGLDAAMQPMELLGVKLGFAAGGYSNTALEDDSTIAQIRPLGILLYGAATVKPGFGVAQLDVTYGLSKELEDAPDRTNGLLFVDVKYGIPILKLTLQPRVRGWYSFNNETDASMARIRPELIVKATF